MINTCRFALVTLSSLLVCNGIFTVGLQQDVLAAPLGPEGSDIASQVATTAESGARTVDYAKAKPIERLLKSSPDPTPLDSLKFGTPGVSLGQAPNTSAKSIQAVQLVPARKIANANLSPRNFGTSKHPFTTARVATNDATVNPAKVYPYSPAGKLFFNVPGGSAVCSASVIKPRVVVTAAHCVSDYGKNKFFTAFSFAPSYTNGTAPFGNWTYKRVFAPASYLNGTAGCTGGVVCPNDVAVLVMNDLGGQKIGNVVGFYGYGWNGFGYTTFLGKQANQLTQLGYPVSLDGGSLMERNDSLSYIDAAQKNNQIIGSLMTGGSSGGPWLVNFGIAPSAPGIDAGSVPKPLVVVGTTSWGFTDSTIKQQGASPFTSTNIVPLVNQACAADPGNC